VLIHSEENSGNRSARSAINLSFVIAGRQREISAARYLIRH
jgi:hypothetical protein